MKTIKMWKIKWKMVNHGYYFKVPDSELHLISFECLPVRNKQSNYIYTYFLLEIFYSI